MLLSPHQEGVRLAGTAIETPSIDSDIPTQGEHFLFEQISRSGFDPFDLEIEMQSFPFHQLNTSGIHPHLLHLTDGFVGTCDVKAPNQIHLA
jgi:hypothetical protein